MLFLYRYVKIQYIIEILEYHIEGFNKTWRRTNLMGENNKNLNEMLEELKKNKYKFEEDTIEFAHEVYSLCVKEKHEKGMAFVLNFLGRAYSDMSKYEKAMEYLFTSIRIARKHEINDIQVRSHINIGNVYFDMGEYEKSFEHYNSAKNLAPNLKEGNNYYEDSSFELYAAKIYNNMGEVYREVKCYEEALMNYNKALDFYNNMEYKDTLGIGIVYTNLGNIEYQLGNYNKALEYLNKSYKYLTNNEYKISIVEACGLLALVYEKLGDYEKCERYFSEAFSIADEIDYAYIKIEVLMDYSNFLENIGKCDLAIETLVELYKISIENRLYAKTMEICKRVIRLYEKIEDIHNANKYYKLYFENEKMLEPIELENRAKNLRIKIKVDNLENENKSITEKNENFKRRADELVEIIKNISIISELGEKITTTLDLDKIFEMIYDTIKVFMKANTFGIGIYNEEKRKIKYHYYIENKDKIKVSETNFDNSSSMAVKCLKENKIIVINDMVNEYLNYIEDVNYINNKDNEELNSAIFCPLIIDNDIIGVLTVQANEKDSFTMLKVEMIKALSSYAAIAINNAIKSKSLFIEVEERRKVQKQLEATNNQLKYLSEYDGLSNIPNRRKFDFVIGDEWERAKKKGNSISIIVFDIDCFKQYNDNYGHTEGDKCIITISNELRKSLIKDYFAARYGGDEFVIILPNTELEEAINFAEGFRKNVENLGLVHEFSRASNFVTVTLGVSSVVPNDYLGYIELIKKSDEALYEAKEKGRNQVVGLLLEK